MLAVGLNPLLRHPDISDRTDCKPGFFRSLATRGKFRRLHVVDLAANDVPVTGFRGFHAPAQKQFAIPKDGKTDPETGEIKTGLPHGDQALAAATISMKAGMSSPKPTGVGPSS